jgi:hypothetical protein
MRKKSDLPVPYSETSTENAGRNGVCLVEMTSDFSRTDPEPKKKPKELGDSPAEDVIDLLVLLGDDLDRQNEPALAGFADFLISKIAAAKAMDSEILYKELILKVNGTDLVNTNEIIKKLTKIYSRTFLIELIKTDDAVKAKTSAYKKILHRADQYLSDI